MSIDKNTLLITETDHELHIQDWLSHQNSLTEKLESFSGQVNIQLLFQQWSRASWWDKHVIKLKDHLVYRREILMFSGALPCWFARTIIPQSCYDLDPAFFTRLEKESLNNLIFNEDKVIRDQLFYYQINKNCIEMHWLPDHLVSSEDKLWLRYSEFSFKNQASFYLCEIMLDNHLRQVQ